MLALTAFAPPASAQSVEPRALRFFPDTLRGHYGTPNPDSTYPNTQRRKLGVVEFDKAAAGQKVFFRVRMVNASAGIKRTVFEGNGEIDKAGKLPFEIVLQRDWPVGDYDVQIAQNDRIIGALPYRVRAVTPRTTAITITSLTINRVSADGKAEPTDEPRTGDRQLRFTAATQGSRTEGANIVWTMTHINEAGASEELATFKLDAMPLEDSESNFNIRLPRDWPAGRYRVHLLIDGAKLGRKEFHIRP